MNEVHEAQAMYTMFYKDALNHDTKFDKLILSSITENLLPFSSIQTKLYNICRPITAQKKNYMLDLLYISPIHHNFFKSLKTLAIETESIGPLESTEGNKDRKKLSSRFIKITIIFQLYSLNFI